MNKKKENQMSESYQASVAAMFSADFLLGLGGGKGCDSTWPQTLLTEDGVGLKKTDRVREGEASPKYNSHLDPRTPSPVVQSEYVGGARPPTKATAISRISR
ncbi:hypothetical protein INR49_024057 [Caranx melampygus]|nr:hypothetical protein INR49_024057 [Caranx melampygus]